jgi:ligand-binding sensor domain-containing protein
MTPGSTQTWRVCSPFTPALGSASLLDARCSASPSAAPAEYHIDSWTTDNGLPQNVIRDVCQTPDGYLRLATMDGLVRFDGVHFAVFNRSNTPGILGNRFTSLYCGRDGEFWASTETSGVTRYRHGSFTTYTIQQGLIASLAGTHPKQLYGFFVGPSGSMSLY